MRFYIGVTDNEWFRFLAAHQPDELNFWQPGGRQVFRAIEPGAPFLFKLHSPLNFIAGGGFFVRHSFLPVSIAWEAFREKNGLATRQEFLLRIQGYRRDRDPDPTIGCIVLAAPFFFEREEWIPAPSDWKGSIVQGKGYDSGDSIGAGIWAAVEERLARREPTAVEVRPGLVVNEPLPRYGAEFLTRARLGQGAFRVLVTEAYSRRCALTGEKTLPVLEAAHIRPYADAGPHAVSNGLLLRSDLHLLFDKGLLTVTPEHRIEISGRIREQYENGRIYYALHGETLRVIPESVIERPSPEFLDWHNRNVFVA